MSEQNKGKPPGPQVQVIRRPGVPVANPMQTTGTVTPTVVPVAPKPVRPSTVAPRPVPRPAPRASSEPLAEGAMAPTTPPPPGAPPSRPAFARAPRVPRGPLTPENINALAKAERVPARIAKGELEGKMKCRVWKKLHREEAKRFDQAYTLMEQHPKLDLPEAFGVVQSGMGVDEFLERRAKQKRKEEVKQARATVPKETIDGFIERLTAQAIDTAFVLGERTVLDTLKEVQPVSFELTRSGRLEKLQVVVVASRTTWDAMSPTLERDPRLSQKPAAVARQPSRRPVSDPRPFMAHLGQTVTVHLRNGLTLTQPLLAVGPFDVLLGGDGNELFVPLHAMMSWVPPA